MLKKRLEANLQDSDDALLPKWKVERMMEAYVEELYENKVLPLHRETSGRLDNLETLLDKIDGGITAVKWMFGISSAAGVVIGAVWGFLQIARVMKG